MTPTVGTQLSALVETTAGFRRFSSVHGRDLRPLAKSLLEPRFVAYGGEVVVSARVLAEPR